MNLDQVIAETESAPSINDGELDQLVAAADRAKLKA